jgi:hypothetical protein
MTPLELKDIPEYLLDSLRGCRQFTELLALPIDGSFSTSSHYKDINIRPSSHYKDINIRRSKTSAKGSVRLQEVVIPWQQIPHNLKVNLAAFMVCKANDLRSISFMAFQRAEGIDSHCDQKWVGKRFCGFSIAVKSEPSSAEPYRLVFSNNKTAVVGEQVVTSNTAYECRDENRYLFKHGVAPSTSGRRFFVRVGYK